MEIDTHTEEREDSIGELLLEPVKYIIHMHAGRINSHFQVPPTNAGQNITICYTICPYELGTVYGNRQHTGEIAWLYPKTNSDICEGNFVPERKVKTLEPAREMVFTVEEGFPTGFDEPGIYRCYRKEDDTIDFDGLIDGRNIEGFTLSRLVDLIIDNHNFSDYLNHPIEIFVVGCSVAQGWDRTLTGITPHRAPRIWPQEAVMDNLSNAMGAGLTLEPREKDMAIVGTHSSAPYISGLMGPQMPRPQVMPIPPFGGQVVYDNEYRFGRPSGLPPKKNGGFGGSKKKKNKLTRKNNKKRKNKNKSKTKRKK